MDYSKVKFVTPSVDGDYFTKGKAYRFFGIRYTTEGAVNDDSGDKVYIRIHGCAHISGNHWIPCHGDGTPLSLQELTPLEAEMLAMLETINEGINTMDFTQLEGLQSEIEDLIKKAKQ